MRTILASVAVLGVTLALCGSARADGRGGHHSDSRHDRDRHDRDRYDRDLHNDYYRTHGHKFEHGYYYKGRDHHHWSREYFSNRYGCTVYTDPGCGCDYYWCQPDSCYYPVSYCPYGRYGW